jgi:hypothetical protein
MRHLLRRPVRFGTYGSKEGVFVFAAMSVISVGEGLDRRCINKPGHLVICLVDRRYRCRIDHGQPDSGVLFCLVFIAVVQTGGKTAQHTNC